MLILLFISCWAISAASQVESDAIIAGYWSKEKQLSVEQLLECDDADFKCQGGWTESAFDYIKNNGLETEDDYPYTAYYADTEKCGDDNNNYVLGIEEFYTVANEDQLVDYVLGTGPISACVDSSTWDTYVDGIIDGTSCGNDVDHCIQIVGVNVKDSYWKIRNTWGEDWGEDGYIRIELGTNACGITTDPIYTVPKLISSEPSSVTTSAPSSATQPTTPSTPTTPIVVSTSSPTPITTSSPTLVPTVITTSSPTLVPTVLTVPTTPVISTSSPTPTSDSDSSESTPTRTHTRQPTEAPTNSPVSELSTPTTSTDISVSSPSSSIISSPSSNVLLSPSSNVISPSSSTIPIASDSKKSSNKKSKSSKSN